jgi:hypothetical protein
MKTVFLERPGEFPRCIVYWRGPGDYAGVAFGDTLEVFPVENPKKEVCGLCATYLWRATEVRLLNLGRVENLRDMLFFLRQRYQYTLSFWL